MKEIRFNLYSFIEFNPKDERGLFRDELLEYRCKCVSLPPAELPNFHEESLRLAKELFLKYDHLILTHENRLFGVDDKKRYLIRDKLNNWFETAVMFNKREE